MGEALGFMCSFEGAIGCNSISGRYIEGEVVGGVRAAACSPLPSKYKKQIATWRTGDMYCAFLLVNSQKKEEVKSRKMKVEVKAGSNAATEPVAQARRRCFRMKLECRTRWPHQIWFRPVRRLNTKRTFAQTDERDKPAMLFKLANTPKMVLRASLCVSLLT